ncbi:septation protein SepH [Cutibacterium equinum]|uniref:Septation protein SepH n=1 Tax=Cutibacterium equinum TaxID=3016342 RepID=A0ABY7R0L3_9ACTN|nr:septation protein SepH [Cutibacterium equinum]WCC80776.1 septation protein SepH [Cutibacterium equinum]
MDSALSPREIQSRIRSGATVEEVAAEAGVGVDQVEPFAVPVLAELDHIIEVAMTCPVRRTGAPGSHRTLGTVISRVAKANSIPDEKISWRSWRHEDRTWALEATWPKTDEEAPGTAMFRFDLKGRHTSPEDAGARWLVNDRSPAPAEPLPAGARDPDQEPTLDLNDELAIVRAVSNRPQRSADPDAVAGMTKHDGVYDFVPSSPADMDMLYEMLAGFQEDSVNIYEGLETPVVDADSSPEPQLKEEEAQTNGEATSADAATTDEPSSSPATDEPEPRKNPAGKRKDPAGKRQAARSTTRTPTPAKDSQHSDDEPAQDALVEGGEQPRTKRKPRKSKRASIPSWDEIMFGGPAPHA